MAYAIKEEQKEYCCISINDRGNYLRVARCIPENKNRQQSIDIREMYTDSDGNIKHGSKGVRIREEQIVEAVTAVLNALDAEELAGVMRAFSGKENEGIVEDEAIEEDEETE